MNDARQAAIGRIVHYRPDGQAIAFINATFADPRRNEQGNMVRDGEIFPAMIIRVWPGGLVNLQVFLDGDATYWATSVHAGEGAGEWSWPPRT